MQIIPVIDVLGGVAVRAVAGRRADYQPLAATRAPLDLAQALARRFRFKTLYIADLDAIEGRGHNQTAIESISAALPGLRLWIDSGARNYSASGNMEAVIGSETLRDDDLERLRDKRSDPQAILSLDFRDGFLGPPALLESPELWPQRVIVMTLLRVGAGAGPDFSTFAHIRACAGDRALYAAGGVRGAEDIDALRRLGAAGALVASALHDGRLTPEDVAAFANPQTEREPRGLPHTA